MFILIFLNMTLILHQVTIQMSLRNPMDSVLHLIHLKKKKLKMYGPEIKPKILGQLSDKIFTVI